MKLQGVDGMRGLPQLVARKLQRFAEREKSYKTLCDLLFEQSENVMAERILCGFRIEKTTYGDCKRDAMTLAKKLKARFADLPSNSVIGLGMDNSLDWIKTFTKTEYRDIVTTQNIYIKPKKWNLYAGVDISIMENTNSLNIGGGISYTKDRWMIDAQVGREVLRGDSYVKVGGRYNLVRF